MKIGKFDVQLLDTGLFALDGGAMFGVVPKTLWSKAYDPGDELNRIKLAASPLLIRYDDKIIVVDSGSGTKLNEKLQKIYDIDPLKSNMDLALEPFDLKGEQVTDFIYTHLHFDHAGGSTKIINGEVVPVFPNAKHYVQKEQYEWALSPSVKDKASFMNENYLPIHSAGMLELLEGDGNIFEGLSVHPIYGHTKAMQMIKISDGGQTLLYVSDLSPTHAHIPIPFVMGYDNYPMTSMDEKSKWFELAAAEGWIICFEHDAYTQGGIIEKNEKGFVLKEKVQITI